MVLMVSNNEKAGNFFINIYFFNHLKHLKVLITVLYAVTAISSAVSGMFTIYNTCKSADLLVAAYFYSLLG